MCRRYEGRILRAAVIRAVIMRAAVIRVAFMNGVVRLTTDL